MFSSQLEEKKVVQWDSTLFSELEGYQFEFQ